MKDAKTKQIAEALAKLSEEERDAAYFAACIMALGQRDFEGARQVWEITVCGYMDERRREFESGRQEALFDAIWMAGCLRAPIPNWTRKPFGEGWQRYKSVVPDDSKDPSTSTLGGAFGITRPAGFNAPAARLWVHYASLVWQKVTERKHAGEPVCEGMFEAVADDIGKVDLTALLVIYGLDPDEAGDLLDARTRKRGKLSPARVREMYYSFLKSMPTIDYRSS